MHIVGGGATHLIPPKEVPFVSLSKCIFFNKKLIRDMHFLPIRNSDFLGFS